MLLRALALGYLLSHDVDRDDFAGWSAQRMPIRDPRALVGLTGSLAGDLDAGHRLAGLHDRPDNAFDRFRQSRYAFSNRATQMVLNGDAAYFSKPLIDAQITAVWREASETDRRRLVYQLQGRLLG